MNSSDQLSDILLQMYKNVINLEDNARKNVNFRINLSIFTSWRLWPQGARGAVQSAGLLTSSTSQSLP